MSYLRSQVDIDIVYSEMNGDYVSVFKRLRLPLPLPLPQPDIVEPRFRVKKYKTPARRLENDDVFPKTQYHHTKKEMTYSKKSHSGHKILRSRQQQTTPRKI